MTTASWPKVLACPKCGGRLYYLDYDPSRQKALWACDCGRTWAVPVGDLEAEAAAKLTVAERRRVQRAARQRTWRHKRRSGA